MEKLYSCLKQAYKPILLFVVISFLQLNASAHVWEIRVNQNQDGTLTWYVQSYHGVSECGHQSSGININGVDYPLQSSFTGGIQNLSPTIFTASPEYTGYDQSCPNCYRASYGVVTTPYIAGALNVRAYSNNVCWDAYYDMPLGNASFIPPPPPACSSCPVTGWSNTLAASGNNNNTPCDLTDDKTTSTISVNHLVCANTAGDKQFRVVFDPNGFNISYGPFFYSSGITTNVVIDIPYGTTNNTLVKVIDDDFPCEVTHGLVLPPNGSYLGETPLVALSNGPQCVGATLRLTSSKGMSSYSWTGPNGFTSSLQSPDIFNVTTSAAGSYTVVAVSACGTLSSTTNVIINALPTPSILANSATTFCQGGGVTLDAGTYTRYNWSTGATTSKIDVFTTGDYSVTVTDANSCMAVASQSVLVNPLPNVNITSSGPASFCEGGSVTLDAGAGYSTYLWNTGSTAQTINVLTGGNYSVDVTNGFGCRASASINVKVNAYPTVSITTESTCVTGSTGTATANSVNSAYYASGGAYNGGSLYTIIPGTGATTFIGNMGIGAVPAIAVNSSGQMFATNGGTLYQINSTTAAATYVGDLSGRCYNVAAMAFDNSDVLYAIDRCGGLYIVNTSTGALTIIGYTNDMSGIQFNPIDGSLWATDRCNIYKIDKNTAVSSYIGYTNYCGISDLMFDESGNLFASQGGGGNNGFLQIDKVSGAATFISNTTQNLAGLGAVNQTLSYLWSNGQTTATASGLSAGTYSVTVTNNSGCSTSASVTLQGCCTTSVTANGPTTFCTGGSVTLMASSGSSYLWNNGATTQSIAVSDAGNYSVTVTNNTCSATSAATTVTVNPLPTATISASGPTTFCTGGSVTLTASSGSSYLWNNGATTQSIAVSDAGNYSVTISNNICSATSAATTVTVNPLPTATISASGPTTFCTGGSVTLTASSGSSYLWNNSATTQSIAVSNAGNYSVTVTNNTCSATSAATTVTVNPLPTATISASGPTTFCTGGTVTLMASPGSSYLWSTGSTTQSITINQTGNYSVTVININDCSATSAATSVTVNPLPTPTISASGSTTFCPGSSVTLTSSAGSSYLWSSGATSQSITVNQSGNYTVTVTDGNSCSATSAATGVSAIDNTNPTITAPPVVNATTNTGCTATGVVLGTPTTRDNCSVASVINDAPVAFPIGNTTVTWTITDGSGNTATATQTVKVTDNQKPVITTNGNTNVNTDANVCGAIVTVIANASDNCSVGTPTGVRSDGLALIAAYPVGTTTIKWNVTDVNGVAALPVTQTVFVLDNQAPSLTCAPNVIVTVPSGGCTASVTVQGPTVTENCSLVLGNGFDFDGTADRITINGLNISPSVRPTLTIEAWINPRNANSLQALVGNDNGGYDRSLNIWNGTYHIFAGRDINTGIVPTLNKWEHVAATWSTAGINFYRNGVLLFTTSGETIDPGPTYTMISGLYTLNGVIDEVRIWNTLRTQAEIQANMNAELSGSQSGLAAYYKFNQGTANGSNAGLTTVAADPSGGAFPGTLSNAALTGTTSNWVTGAQPQSFSLVNSFNNTASASGNYPIGVTTIKWTATDASGNSSLCNQTVTVTDNQKPVITTNGNKNVSNDLNLCSAAVTVSASATDNCSVGIPTGVRNDGFALTAAYPIGTTTITWNVTDINGVAALPVTQTVTVADNQIPTFTGVPLSATVECDAIPLPSTVTALDNCPGVSSVSFNEQRNTGSCPNNYTITRTWSATDANGNLASATQVITVRDNTAPTFTAPADITLYKDANCNVDASPNGLAKDVTNEADNCSTGLNATFSDVKVDNCQGTYTITRTWSLVDNCGNAAVDQVQTITVKDNTAPTFTAPADITLYKDADCNVDASPNGLAKDVTNEADNCSTGLNATFSDVKVDNCQGTYTITRTWSLVDNCGNAAVDQVQTITVKDNTAPTFTAPADITLYKDANCNVDASPNGLAKDVTNEADNCSTGLNATFSDVKVDNCQGTYTITRTWSLVDNCGNAAATQVQTITVKDNTAPTFTAPADITLYKDANCNVDASPNGLAKDVTNEADNCSTGLNATFSDVKVDNCQGTYTITRTWSLVDNCGNAAATQVQTITVKDNTAPTFTAPADITLYKDANCNVDASPNGLAKDVTNEADNCSTGLNATFSDVKVDNCQGTYTITRTWSLTDNCGNSAANQIQTITVKDNTAPTFTAPADITLYKDADCNVDASPNGLAKDVTNEADNCSTGLNATFSDVKVDNCQGTYTITRTWSLVDNCGNAAVDQVQTITVKDNTAPTFTAPADITLYKDANCNVDASPNGLAKDVTNEADNCSTGLNATFSDVKVDNCQGTYTITRTWSLVDNCGNAAATQVQTITVKDNTAPTFTAPADITLYKDANCNVDASPNGLAKDVTNEADNCSTGLNATFSDVKVDNCQGTYTITRTWSLVDNCGNAAATQVQTITVKDNTAPTFTAPADITLYKDANCNVDASPNGLAKDVTNEADNCSTGLNATFSDVKVDNCQGTYTITRTWSLTDNCGNSAANQIQTITVKDNTAPTFTAPADITLYKDANCNVDASPNGLAKDVTNEADNCSTGLNATFSDVKVDNCQGTYTITRTWSLVDNCGNAAADQVQVITVSDNTIPTFTAPANLTIYTSATCTYDASLAATGDVENERDNCDGALQATYSDVTTPGACAGSYTITRTWSLKDCSGNAAADQVQVITVSDNTIPTFTAPADITLYKDANCKVDDSPNGLAKDVTNEADNCSTGVNATFSDVKVDNCQGTYTITRTWSLIDNCGNAAVNQVQVITVSDNTAPILNCSTNKNRIVNNGLCTYKVIGNEFDISATDNCSPAITYKYVLSGATTQVVTGSLANVIFGNGVTTVKASATDGCNNVSTCTFTVTVSTTLAATLPANVYALSSTAGINANTIYIGYTPAAQLSIKATPTGGNASSYSYQWSIPNNNLTIVSGGTSQTVVITSTVANSTLPYRISLTLTDGFGCTTTITKDVYVINTTCDKGKVEICQVNNGNTHTICVSPNAVPAHLAKGDYLGACNTKPTTVAPEVMVEVVDINVYPNPNNGVFAVQLRNFKATKATVSVMDESGKAITEKVIYLMGKGNTVSFDLSNQASAMYFIKVVSDDGVQTAKVIVQH